MNNSETKKLAITSEGDLLLISKYGGRSRSRIIASASKLAIGQMEFVDLKIEPIDEDESGGDWVYSGSVDGPPCSIDPDSSDSSDSDSSDYSVTDSNTEDKTITDSDTEDKTITDSNIEEESLTDEETIRNKIHGKIRSIKASLLRQQNENARRTKILHSIKKDISDEVKKMDMERALLKLYEELL